MSETNKQKIPFMVCVSCMTYNQAIYIEDAMNGFCMQETTFPFVCTIIDDASTDGEPEVIQKYLQEHFDLEDKSIVRNEETDDYYLTFARHKTNLNCFFSVLYLKYNHYCIKKAKKPYIKEWYDTKYIASCEGDDYWIDSLKLQKQFEFMEQHPENSLCFCAYKVLFPTGEEKEIRCYEASVEKCPIEDIILGGSGYMATNSMFYRKSMYVPYTTWAIDCPVGDGPLKLTLSHKGKVGYLANVMCVYRKNAIGSWSLTMASDRKKRNHHYHAIIKTWNQFDEWSDRKYHKIVVKKIRKNIVDYYKGEVKSLIRRILNR